MKKRTVAVWALLASISCSAMAADPVSTANDGTATAEKKVGKTRKKHGTVVKSKTHSKKSGVPKHGATDKDSNSGK